ncbi:uncharacterized protein LOC110856072 isoform X1 [Folsomia candida]|uniref:Uncharacterized protein n=1 Tax=Folsomia candida TaxID=158441 RepID=A0A226DPN7_FOLCA|nr:uncharacterized protein LOC110856072 isoform X1 [Folsomia candida]OXA46804.1 hypothetical protein Fcan01_18231 [Folsomia candida]
MAKSRCCSLESAVLFGSCAFTFDTLLKLWDLSFSVILIGYNWNKYGNLVVRPQVISAFFASVYCTFSLILAFFLFKGIFKKLPGVIKLGAIFVLVLRLWECAGSLVSWDDASMLGIAGSTPQVRDEFGVYRAAKIGRFIVVNSTAAVFVGLLFAYYRSLLPPSSRNHRRHPHRHQQNGDAKINRNSNSPLSI